MSYLNFFYIPGTNMAFSVCAVLEKETVEKSSVF